MSPSYSVTLISLDIAIFHELILKFMWFSNTWVLVYISVLIPFRSCSISSALISMYVWNFNTLISCTLQFLILFQFDFNAHVNFYDNSYMYMLICIYILFNFNFKFKFLFPFLFLILFLSPLPHYKSKYKLLDIQLLSTLMITSYLID